MRTLFYIGVILLGIFEILNVYFIMPMPGSQRMESGDSAYFLSSCRWSFRIALLGLIAAGGNAAFNVGTKWIPGCALLPVAAIVYMFDFRMTADHMFLQPRTV